MLSLKSYPRRGALAGFSLLLTLTAPWLSAQPPAPEPQILYVQDPLPLDELRNFAEIYERIKQAYVQPIDDNTLLEYAIKGMLAGLDPHSAYLSAQDYDNLQESTEGEFGGLGIEVGVHEDGILVISPIDDTPASRAGLKPQDVIIRINQTPTRGLSLSQGVDLMRGAPGTQIELGIRRGSQTFDVSLTRAVIAVTSVKTRLLEPHYGYIRISQFQTRTGKDVQEALADLFARNQGDLRGLILDLRNNPGGILQSAVAVADAFLTEGLIVYTEGRLPDAELRFSADAQDPSQGVPLIVLINAGSASASEIVAGALQDHKRAVLMGSASFGKGSVQSVLPLKGERALKLTTALYFTPSGRSIQAQGIMPDIKVQNVRVTPVEQPNAEIREANLAGHLNNAQEDNTKAAGQNSSTQTSPVTSGLSAEDYLLGEALNLLKGWQILRAQHNDDN
ncbi:carboxyl-terminal processing protease [Allopseudospirillum japonicum]|uniref:Carboxyl-terminal processing protease n=1 Tax=Allopseudospirillum japonicum TaxID=64971 RepID=A0A1H6RLE4_9GAMM|nr:S41 family peptidase [Allopseudospirillum japonicum]SEI52012.1 carboxyl-terminal processing protease [Allopseudospirillum japonicum]